jgi:hypothetical protein
VRQQPQPFAQQRIDLGGGETVADRLQTFGISPQGGPKDPTNAERSRGASGPSARPKRSIAQRARNANEPVAAAVAPVTHTAGRAADVTA